MSESKEGFFAKLGAIGQVIGVMVAVLGIVVARPVDHGPAEIVEAPSPAVAPSTSEQNSLPQPDISPSSDPPTIIEPIAKEDRAQLFLPSRRHQSVLPLDLTLRDGEQQTFLGDQASVTAEFNRIGSEEFVTLRLGTTESESVPHAVVGAGDQFPIVVAGSHYSVYVLNVDKSARSVGVRISRTSKTQQERGQ